jgi:hypothetical protein
MKYIAPHQSLSFTCSLSVGDGELLPIGTVAGDQKGKAFPATSRTLR